MSLMVEYMCAWKLPDFSNLTMKPIYIIRVNNLQYIFKMFAPKKVNESRSVPEKCLSIVFSN